MNVGARATRVAASVAVGCVLAQAASDCWAQASAPLRRQQNPEDIEIAPFRLTGSEGHVEARYLSDDILSSGPVGGLGLRTRQSNVTEEIFLMTHSYVYHPSLLSLDLGGGPVFDKSHSDVDGVVTDSKRPLYSLSARATILRDKPYTGNLFYERHNQTQPVGPAQAILAQNTRYGGTFWHRNPTLVPLQVDLTRTENHAEGARQIIHDRTDQLHVKLEADLADMGMSTFQYVGTRQDSASGSAGLPILASSGISNRANLDTRVKFGARSEHDLGNAIGLSTSRYTFGPGSLRERAELKDFNFGLDLRGRHSHQLQSFGRYDFRTSKQNDQETTSHTAGAGVSYYLNPELSGTLGARAEDNRASQFSAALYAIDGTAQYLRILPVGQLTLGYNFSYSQRDQQTTAFQVRTIGERVTLAGTTFTTLGKQQIISGSVIVSNLTRTQIFVEGQDYVLSQIGLSLRIQRLIGGNILDGQEVLTDYDAAVGGSYAITQLDNSVNLSWTYRSYFSVFARHLHSTPRLVSGAPTAPINPVESTIYGLRADFPLPVLAQDLLLGASAERENRRETILPYQRESYEAYAQAESPLVGSGNIRIGTRRLQVDYANHPARAMDLRAYDVRLQSRLAYDIVLSVEATRERDTGTPVVRERSFASAKAQWRQRKLSLTVDLTRAQDVQGATRTKRSYGQVVLRRDL